MILQDSMATITTKKNLVSVIIENTSKIKEIFYLEGFPINGQPVSTWLEIRSPHY